MSFKRKNLIVMVRADSPSHPDPILSPHIFTLDKIPEDLPLENLGYRNAFLEAEAERYKAMISPELRKLTVDESKGVWTYDGLYKKMQVRIGQSLVHPMSGCNREAIQIGLYDRTNNNHLQNILSDSKRELVHRISAADLCA